MLFASAVVWGSYMFWLALKNFCRLVLISSVLVCEQVKEYATTRRSLKRVCLLVDAKWGLKPRDEELLYLMEKYGHSSFVTTA